MFFFKTTMNPGITNKILLNTNFQRNLCRYLSIQQSINKRSNNGCTTNFYYKNETRHSLLFSRNLTRKSLCYTPVPLYINFQKRNIASEASSTASLTSDSLPVEEIAKLETNVPEMFKGFYDWKIVELAQKALLQVHETTGLPWWASIMVSAFIARSVVTLPFSIIQVHNSAKLEKIQTEMNDIVKNLKSEANYLCQHEHWPESLAKKEYQKKVKKQWDKLVVRENCHPAKSYILILVQLPLWFSFSIATRNLCYMLPEPSIHAKITYMELMLGGFGWVKNLAEVDHYMILPIALGLLNLAIIEVHQLFGPRKLRRLDRWKTNFFRFISITIIPLAGFLPAATNLYWLTSSLFGLLQAFLLNSSWVKRLVGVPLVSDELKHPYRYFLARLKSRLGLANK